MEGAGALHGVHAAAAGLAARQRAGHLGRDQVACFRKHTLQVLESVSRGCVRRYRPEDHALFGAPRIVRGLQVDISGHSPRDTDLQDLGVLGSRLPRLVPDDLHVGAQRGRLRLRVPHVALRHLPRVDDLVQRPAGALCVLDGLDEVADERGVLLQVGDGNVAPWPVITRSMFGVAAAFASVPE